MAFPIPASVLNLRRLSPPSLSSSCKGKGKKMEKGSSLAYCAPLEQQSQPVEDVGIICEPCIGRGWLLCPFCEGQKINVKSENNRIYRRCPSCRAIGYVLCSKCKVFKCVTFPDFTDGEL